MVQGGDPDGTATGGTSIWGAPFEDEFPTRFATSRRVSMANSGSNTNEASSSLCRTSPE
jgi:peptidyl-prolyl cis-trans isomerase B (cyclophilin B)